MNTRKATIAITLTALLILVVWDVWVFVEPTEQDTISEITLSFAQQWIVIPHSLGVVLGHLLWPSHSPWPRKVTIPILVGITLALLGSDIAFALLDSDPSFIRQHPMISGAVGIISGRLLWAQED